MGWLRVLSAIYRTDSCPGDRMTEEAPIWCRKRRTKEQIRGIAAGNPGTSYDSVVYALRIDFCNIGMLLRVY